MGTRLATPIAQDQVDAFWRDGACCLRGMIDQHWIGRLRAAVEDDLRGPGPLAIEYAKNGGRFLGDIGVWAIRPELRAFVFESPAAEIAATFLRAERVRFFYDHLFVKEPGTAERTPWHQDQPYWPVAGRQVLSIWLALDDVTLDSSGMEYVKGSHAWGKTFRPRHFSGADDPYKDLPGEPIPDFDALRGEHTFLSWDMKAGDCLLHHAMTVHGSAGNATSNQRRRAYATRWVGEDATYAPRAGQPRLTIDPIPLSPGDPLECAVFPCVLPRSGA